MWIDVSVRDIVNVGLSLWMIWLLLVFTLAGVGVAIGYFQTRYEENDKDPFENLKIT